MFEIFAKKLGSCILSLVGLIIMLVSVSQFESLSGLWVAIPLWLWAAWLNTAANHTVIIAGTTGKKVKRVDPLEERLAAMEKAMKTR